MTAEWSGADDSARDSHYFSAALLNYPMFYLKGANVFTAAQANSVRLSASPPRHPPTIRNHPHPT